MDGETYTLWQPNPCYAYASCNKNVWQKGFTFFFQTCRPVQHPSCAKNVLKSVVLRWQQDQNFILQHNNIAHTVPVSNTIQDEMAQKMKILLWQSMFGNFDGQNQHLSCQNMQHSPVKKMPIYLHWLLNEYGRKILQSVSDKTLTVDNVNMHKQQSATNANGVKSHSVDTIEKEMSIHIHGI